MNRKRIGKHAESLACGYLKRRGLRLLSRNFRCRRGEIDLIMQDGDSLVFSIQNRPGWASFNSSTGRLTGTPTTGDVGTYSNIRISVSDGSISTALAAFSLTVSSSAPQTGSVSLSWLAPTARSDGTPLSVSEIAGYTLYYGSSAGNYSNSIRIDDPFTTSVTMADLPVGTYYFVMTTRDVSGQESGYSAEAQRQVQ